MKKNIVLLLSLVFGFVAYAQNFTDNFDSYSAGDYLTASNPAWDTWSGGIGGGPEDVQISNADAFSMPNSIYFKSNAANGGPADVILRFDDVYTSGNFSLDFNIKVLQNKGAYFNLQQNHIVGDVWAVECYLLQNGTIRFTNGSGGNVMLTGNYPNGQWFNLKMNINLTTNEWEIFVNNNSIGVFSNSINSIGIWDIYPVNLVSAGGNGQSEFYIDDVSYSHTPAFLPTTNAGVTYINPIEGLSGQNVDVVAKVRNLGSSTVSSFDLTYQYTGGITVSESVSGLSLSSLDVYEHVFITPVTLVSGVNPLSVAVSNVNNLGQDDDNSDDSKSIYINPVVPASGKIVLGEEATGTWCQYCPRGAVFMDYMANKYEGFWAGVAVHNNDPMAFQTYDFGLGTIIGGSYPSATVERRNVIDPSEVEESFIERIVKEPTAIIQNGAYFDATSRELDVTLTFIINSDVPNIENWKVACILTEDGVKGVGSGYAQSNAYSGGGLGEMGGYESLPNPVPASMMIYDHVAREIFPSFGGEAGMLPDTLKKDDIYTVCFKFTLPDTWDEAKMNIIGILIGEDNKVDNASYSTIEKAIESGIKDCGNNGTTSVVTNELNNSFRLYPNPANNLVFIDVLEVYGEQIFLTVTNMTGEIIAKRTYLINGSAQIPINTEKFAKGSYIVTLQKGNNISKKMLIVR